MAAEAAVDLLTVDVAAVTARVTADLLEAEKAELETMDEKALFAEAAKIEAELQRAVAALQAKSGADMTADAEAPKPIGPCTAFEGTPIDCGLIAASAVQAADEDVAYLEAELAKATAALETAKATPKAAEAAASTSSPARSPSKIALDMLDAGLTKTAEKTNLPRQTVAAAAAATAVAAVAGLVGIFAKGRRK